MARRSNLSQLEQVAASLAYNDLIANANTQLVAEGQSSLEGDMNVMRTLLRELIGNANWYDSATMDVEAIIDEVVALAEKYFPSPIHKSGFDNVIVSGSSTTAFDSAIKTITDHNDGQGSEWTKGVVIDSTRKYKIEIRDHLTQDNIDDGSGNPVYGRLDFVGTQYVIDFYSWQSGVEVGYSFVTPLAIDVAYVIVSTQFQDLSWDRFFDFEFNDAIGMEGAQGDYGPQGSQGFQGFRGVQGFQGFQGHQGFQGSIGYQGIQGGTGADGVQGSQGNQGFQGAVGTIGSQGFQGIVGIDGFQGAQGNTGTDGVQGFQGTDGVQGFQGSSEVGIQGFQGIAGLQGFQGIAGLQGFQGIAGTDGLQGFQGISEAGFQGFQGDEGPVAGIDRQVIFNNAGEAGAQTGFQYDITSGILTSQEMQISNQSTQGGVLVTDGTGLLAQSGVLLTQAPTGGSVVNFSEYTSTPTGPQSGDFWIQAVDANTKSFNYYDGTDTYSVQLTK